MARFSAGNVTGAGSTTLPVISLYAGATGGAIIRAIGLFNTTVTAVLFKVMRLTTAGTSTAIASMGQWDFNSGPPLCTARQTHSVAPTLGADLGYRAVLGAGIGAATIFTFGGEGLQVAVGVANGIGVLVESGTGQAVSAFIDWEE